MGEKMEWWHQHDRVIEIYKDHICDLVDCFNPKQEALVRQALIDFLTECVMSGEKEKLK